MRPEVWDAHASLLMATGTCAAYRTSIGPHRVAAHVQRLPGYGDHPASVLTEPNGLLSHPRCMYQ